MKKIVYDGKSNIIKPPLIINREKSGFGDYMMTGLACITLLDNGFNAFLPDEERFSLIDCPKIIIDDKIEKHMMHYFEYTCKDTGNAVLNFLKQFRINKLSRNYVPVKYTEQEVPYCDVALGTRVGGWSGKTKQYPYFDELKKLLDNNKISYIDLDREYYKQSNKILNIVKKAKVYVGLETGLSHYVSKYANGKRIILCEGCVRPELTVPYDYKIIISTSLPSCFPCCPSKCDKCISSIKPETIMEKIKKKL